MINPNELLFCVDENNNPIQALPRNIVHRDHIWHRSTDIWVTNSSHTQILCHKRSAKKDTHPSLFDSTFGGHILANETPDQNVDRELYEELGIKTDYSHLRFISIIPLTQQYEFQYRYLYELHEDISRLKYETEEIDSIFWSDIDEIIKIYRERIDALWVYREAELKILHYISAYSKTKAV